MAQLPLSFHQLMVVRFLFTLGVQMQAVLLGWQMYSLTHDPLYLGLTGLAEAVPAIGLALFSGHVVDKGRPLLIFRRVVEMSLLSAAIMLAAQLPQVGLDRQGQVLALFASSFLTGAARAFTQPSLFALVPKLVPRQHLPRASAWMTSFIQVARISGPAVGGILYGFLGMGPSSWVVCLILLAALMSVFFIRIQDNSSVSSERRPITQELMEGVRFVLKHPILFPSMNLDMISVLLGGVTALLPIFAAEILHVGAEGLGLLRAAPAIGAVLTSTALAYVNYRQRAGLWLLWAVAGFGVSILLFAFSTSFPLSVLALGLSGACDSVSMVIRTAIVQLASPEAMRGRISAVNSIFISSSNELGEFESGVAARLLGAVGAALFGGVACLCMVGLTAALAKKLRMLNLDQLKSEREN